MRYDWRRGGRQVHRGVQHDVATCAATLAPISVGGAPWTCPACCRAVVGPVPTPLQPDVALPWCPFCATLAEPAGSGGLALGQWGAP